MTACVKISASRVVGGKINWNRLRCTKSTSGSRNTAIIHAAPVVQHLELSRAVCVQVELTDATGVFKVNANIDARISAAANVHVAIGKGEVSVSYQPIAIHRAVEVAVAPLA